jgi:outer membrane protein assembly factor BamD (BamD/ComL family)
VLYENSTEWPLAIARAEGLVLNHPGSPLAIAAQARAPELRLKRIQSPEYDRQELERARQELQEWLVTHSTNVLEPKVRLDLADCLVRLCESDLQISKFYVTVKNPFGAQRHARRAIEEARDSGDAERLAAAEAWQLTLPPATDPITGSEVLP